MRAETRHSLKEDRFRGATIQAAERTAHWTVEHQKTLLIAGVLLLAALAVGIFGWYYLSQQDEKASLDLNQATRTLETPIGPAVEPGATAFASAKERATAARKQFQAIVDNYSHTKTADIARYFVGVTSADLNDYPAAEKSFGEASHSSNSDLAALANLALASVYPKDNKDSQAIALYKQLVDHPTNAVSKATAQIELAGFYQSKQQPAEAKRLYEQVQKENPSTQAAQLAAQKLTALNQ